MLRITHGCVFDGIGFSEHDIALDEGRFVAENAEQASPDTQVLDARGCYVIPGLIDIHFHGSAGADTSDGSVEVFHCMGAYEASRGITAICPATMTFPEDILMSVMTSAKAYTPADDEAELVGINMEGPFISPDKVGAQNPAHVSNPDVGMFRRLQEAAGGLVKLVDIAPEQPGADEFIEQLAGEVRISLAHTCADYDTAYHAFDLGARQITHLYNAMNTMHHRNPGPILAAIEHPQVTAEIICDGVHIHPAMVRLAFREFGDDRMIMISDSLRAAGLGDGVYDLGGQDVTVRGPRATIAAGNLAGSVSDLMQCFVVAVRDMAIPLESVVKATTVNPARALGIDNEYGSLEPGHIANAVLLDKETLAIKQVILRGKVF